MPFREAAGVFTEDELRVMQIAYDGACAELGLTLADGDKFKREHVAAVIIELSQGALWSPETLQRDVVLRIGSGK